MSHDLERNYAKKSHKINFNLKTINKAAFDFTDTIDFLDAARIVWGLSWKRNWSSTLAPVKITHTI